MRTDREPALWRQWLHSVGDNRTFFYLLAGLFLLVLADLKHPLSWRNLNLLAVLLWLPGLLILWQNLRLSFLLLFLASLFSLVRLLLRRNYQETAALSPNVPVAGLRLLLILLVLFHLGTIANGGVDDAGIWGAKGPQFVLEHGYLPYGQIGEGGTYGPLEYLLFIPVTLILPPGGLEPYNPDNFWGAKLMAMASDLLMIGGLWAIGQRVHSETLGVSLAFSYIVLPYAFMVWGLYFLTSPVVSGALLAAASATLFYPAFAFPLWLSWFHQRGRGLPFALAFGLPSLALLSLVLLGESNLQAFYENTLVNQEGTQRYGGSSFGFWGQFSSLAFLKPAVLGAYLAFCAFLLFRPRNMTVYQFVVLTAAVVLGTQLWKTHGGGTYVGCFLPLLLLAVLWPTAREETISTWPRHGASGLQLPSEGTSRHGPGEAEAVPAPVRDRSRHGVDGDSSQTFSNRS